MTSPVDYVLAATPSVVEEVRDNVCLGRHCWEIMTRQDKPGENLWDFASENQAFPVD